MQHMARAGKSGQLPKNASRDLLRKLCKSSVMPELYYADVPMFDASSGTTIPTRIPFLLPHEVLGSIYRADMATIDPAMDHLR